MDEHKDLVEKTKGLASSVGDGISKTATVIKDTAKTVIVTTFDQTKSGTIGQEDIKILTEKGKTLAVKAADEVIVVVKEAKNSDLFKEAAAGSLVGAVIAIPMPFIGPLMGAAIGGAIGVYVHVVRSTKKR